MEERVGERRPFTNLNAAVRGGIPAGCRTNISGAPAENHGLLSLTLSSKGGEGKGAAALEHQVACKEQNLPVNQAHAEIYQRATNEFAEADFFKPAEPKTNDLTSSLTPLILQEVNGAKEPPPQLDWFGTLSLSNGVLVLDRSHPAIYWQADSIQLKGRAHTRFSYLWCYSTGASGSKRGLGNEYPSPGQAETSLALQGIRITLNSAGQPVIWEVLADSSGTQVIYVSQNLEAAAVAEFGQPLPGRRYAIERSPEDAPKVIVARIIDDGPVAMGPIVYLSVGARAVTTLICRCMPAQAKRLLVTSAYDLLPFQATTAQSLLTQVRALARQQTAFWLDDPPSSDPLEKRLRLPSRFWE